MAKLSEQVIQREKEVSSILEEHATLFGIDPNVVRALITQESRFISDARSPTGAFGYGQFTNIAAKQVQIIASMTPLASDLADFQKNEASDPDRGIKAVCATLWWLFNRKYPHVTDKKVQLEAVLTFYNAGGIPASLVINKGGHANALADIKNLSPRRRSQADIYAPEVSEWYILWHELMLEEDEPVVVDAPKFGENPFDPRTRKLDVRYKALVEALRLLASEDPMIDLVIESRLGMTEFTLIFPGELNDSKEES